MKKAIILFLVAVVLLASAYSAGANEQVVSTAAETHFATVLNGKGELIEVEFPSNPERIAVLNFVTLDFLDAIGMGDKVVGVIKAGSFPAHLQKYKDNENIANLGSMKAIDMEKLMSLQPDVIFSSDRTAKRYDEFSMIAPTMSAAIKYEEGFFQGFKNLVNAQAAVLNVDASVINPIIEDYSSRIANIAKFADGKTALLGIFAGGLNTLGDVGRAAIVTTDMGFTNLQLENVNHGNISSYEAWLELNPEYMFILDKDTAVGTQAVAAKEQMEVNNPIIAQTEAYKNGNMIYLEPGDVWYLCDGGVTGMDLMIECIEKGLGL